MTVSGKRGRSSARKAARGLSLLPGLAVLTVALWAPPTQVRADRDHEPRWWEKGDASRARGDDTTQVVIRSKVTQANNIGLTFFNSGFFGNNLSSRNASLEYPLGSTQEHLIRAGLWIGGIIEKPGEPGVFDTLTATATIDGSINDANYARNSEFFPSVSEITEMSILPNSRFFSDDAKSEQDLLTTYHDVASFESDYTESLGIVVNQEILQFSFEPFDAIILVNLHITTNTFGVVFDPYVGFYAEFASGWKDGHAEWPPSGWFDQKDIAYIDSLRLGTEHHYNNDGGNAPSWAGAQLLGIRGPTVQDTVSAKRVSYNWWNWDPSGNQPGQPSNDPERYLTLSNGSVDATAAVEAPNNDPVSLLSVGPLGRLLDTWPDGRDRFVLQVGDTVTVSIALLGGEPVPHEGRSAKDDIILNAQWAQTAFNLNFNIPVPPPSPSLVIFPDQSRITLRWDALSEDFIDPKSRQKDFEGYRVYVSETKEQTGFHLIREFDLVDSVFFNTGLDEIETEPIEHISGEDTLTLTYRYDVTDVRDGFKYWVAVTSFDSGTPDVASLESGISQNRTMVIPGPSSPSDRPDDRSKVSVFPNPYRGDAVWDGRLSRDRYLWFINLPRRCTIHISTLAGDLVDTIEFDGSTYDAREIRGIFDPTDPADPDRDLPELSGGMVAWDLITQSDQGIASGLYLFAVEDHETGGKQIGKFLILK